MQALREARLVGQLVDELLRADDVQVAAEDRQLVDRPVLLREPHHALDRRVVIEVADVADDRPRRRLRDAGMRGHATPSSSALVARSRRAGRHADARDDVRGRRRTFAVDFRARRFARALRRVRSARAASSPSLRVVRFVAVASVVRFVPFFDAVGARVAAVARCDASALVSRALAATGCRLRGVGSGCSVDRRGDRRRHRLGDQRQQSPMLVDDVVRELRDVRHRTPACDQPVVERAVVALHRDVEARRRASGSTRGNTSSSARRRRTAGSARPARSTPRRWRPAATRSRGRSGRTSRRGPTSATARRTREVRRDRRLEVAHQRSSPRPTTR